MKLEQLKYYCMKRACINDSPMTMKRVYEFNETLNKIDSFELMCKRVPYVHSVKNRTNSYEISQLQSSVNEFLSVGLKAQYTIAQWHGLGEIDKPIKHDMRPERAMYSKLPDYK